MYNVVIVDDEPVIRFGLKASINWEQEGLCLLGDYPNGEEAFKAMKNTHVDILITDIKMPVMDGITLMKKTLERFPKAKIILVSSYNDFEYVREGIKHGAVDYLLKPTLEPEEFLQQIQKCVEMLKHEQLIAEKLILMEKENSLRERKKLEYEIKRILLNEKERLNLHDIFGMTPGPFIIACMKMNQVVELEEQYGYLFKSFLLEEIQEQFYLRQKDGICFPVSEVEMVFLLPKTNNPQEVINSLKKTIEKETGIFFTFGYDMISHLDDIETGFERCIAASKRGFFKQQKDLFTYEVLEGTKLKPLKAEQLSQFLLPYDEQKVAAFLRERYKQWRHEVADPSNIKDEACDVLTQLFKGKVELSTLLDKCMVIKKTETLNELYQTLLNQIKELDLILAQKSEKAYADNELLDAALEFIHNNYTQELTLQSVAKHIHISRNYFSILFKRYLNQNFIDYVINLRINKAKELLSHTSLKVYEVAEKSGFKDVKYFSKLFKKITEFSPGDYRIENQK